MNRNDRKRNELLLKIAKEHLTLDTLETQKCGEDFQEQAVWCIKDALEAAYIAGQQSKEANK